jgi:hypothetical protein
MSNVKAPAYRQAGKVQRKSKAQITKFKRREVLILKHFGIPLAFEF